MARDGLLLFPTFAGGTTATGGTKQTSATLTIDPFIQGHRRELVVRFTVNATTITGAPTGIAWVFSVEASDDGTNFFTVCGTPGQVLGAATTGTFAQLPDGLKMTVGAVTANIADGGVTAFLPVVVPQTYIDSSGVVQDNYNRLRVTATPVFNGGSTPNVTYVSAAAIVSGKDGSYS
jgi:hypothetical protein